MNSNSYLSIFTFCPLQLASFVRKSPKEFTEELGDSEEGAKLEEALRVSSVEVQQVWQLFVDGAAN